MEANRKIAVIDDDADIRELIRAYFRPKGFHVEGFESAEAALDATRNQQAPWDVVLTDLKLPQMSGVDFTVALKETHPQLPVILITTQRSVETALEAVQKGAYDFLVKPLHLPQVHLSVERAIRHKDMQGDLIELRERVKTPGQAGKIIGKSPSFLAALDIARRVAKSKANIFISGESGTGKEVFARFIHEESSRKKYPFLAINCSAIPENLLESELFGHAKGAFTGAQDKREGLFEAAGDGTLFLDEIGDLPLVLQAKLLRVLQERKVKRIGENQYRNVECRVLSATHRDLTAEIAAGRFREDLFYRLNVIPIHLPPLRERREDILPLAESFLRRFAAENGVACRAFSKGAIRVLLDNPWRGNVRELENAIERAVVLSLGPEVHAADLAVLGQRTGSPIPTYETEDPITGSRSAPEGSFSIDCSEELPDLDQAIQRYIEFALKRNRGARDRTAKLLGIDRKTLYRRLRPQEPESIQQQNH